MVHRYKGIGIEVLMIGQVAIQTDIYGDSMCCQIGTQIDRKIDRSIDR